MFGFLIPILSAIGGGSAVVGAAVAGAVIGGAVAAIEGDNILEGALKGGLIGAVAGIGITVLAPAAGGAVAAGESTAFTGAGGIAGAAEAAGATGTSTITGATVNGTMSGTTGVVGGATAGIETVAKAPSILGKIGGAISGLTEGDAMLVTAGLSGVANAVGSKMTADAKEKEEASRRASLVATPTEDPSPQVRFSQFKGTLGSPSMVSSRVAATKPTTVTATPVQRVGITPIKYPTIARA